MKLFFVAAVLVLSISSAYSLSCLPCNETVCAQVACEGKTTVPDVCGCCQVCSKQKGEVCGGPWQISGVCDPEKNLTCLKFVRPDELEFNLEGTCQNSESEGLCSYPYMFTECASACQPDCDERNPLFCTLQCVLDECVCGPGFIRRSKTNRTCIPAEECPRIPIVCDAPKILSDCATACPPTCGNPYPRICTKRCDLDPCICPTGLLMRSLTDRTCVKSHECEDFSFCEKSCPPLDFGASSCQLRESWSCWLDQWKCNTYQWKMEMEKWWSQSCSTGNVESEDLWQGVPECSKDYEVKCIDPDQQVCDLDAFGCYLCQCADGKYQEPLQLLEIWKRSNNMMMAFNSAYKKAKEECVSVAGGC